MRVNGPGANGRRMSAGPFVARQVRRGRGYSTASVLPIGPGPGSGSGSLISATGMIAPSSQPRLCESESVPTVMLAHQTGSISDLAAIRDGGRHGARTDGVTHFSGPYIGRAVVAGSMPGAAQKLSGPNSPPPSTGIRHRLVFGSEFRCSVDAVDLRVGHRLPGPTPARTSTGLSF